MRREARKPRPATGIQTLPEKDRGEERSEGELGIRGRDERRREERENEQRS